MIVKRGKKSLHFGVDRRNVTIAFSIGELLKAQGVEAQSARFVHKMSPKKARFYAGKLIKFASAVEQMGKVEIAT